MDKHKLKVAIILSVLFISTISFIYFYSNKSVLDKVIEKQEKITYYTDIINSYNTGEIINNFSDISSTGEILELKNNIDNGDFVKTQELVKKIVSKIPDNSKLDESTKAKKVALKYIELGAILNTGNYYYKEKEIQKEVENILNEIKAVDPILFDNFYGNYYLGYSKEIIKEYDKALEYYNKAMIYSNNKNKVTSSIILNQIGHVYDLRGDMNKAYEYYFKAYNLNNKNYPVALNIARYLIRIGALDKSKEFFKYSLNTRNNTLKSEIYFSLSSLELELNGFKPDIEKSIEYAKLGIQAFPDYPMNYLALAKGYYMLNDSKYDKEIDDNLSKSIKLNPNGHEAYRYYGLHMYDKSNFMGSLIFLEKSKDLVGKDMILMDDTRKLIYTKLEQEIIFLTVLKNISNEKDLIDIITNKITIMSFGKDIIRLQFKRINSGILLKFKDKIDFANILKYK